MLAVERGLAWLGLLAGISLLAWPTRVALALVTGWFLAVAGLTVYQGGEFGSEYAVFAHATRYLGPVGLIFLLDAERRALWAERVLRAAAALTFAAHGIEALAANPRFIDFVITAFRRVDVAIAESTTRALLVVIGVQDLLLAALVVARRWRWVAAYMAFWGAITAASRMVHMGLGQWPATLLRAANAAVPLALFFWWATPRDGAAEEQHDQRKS